MKSMRVVVSFTGVSVMNPSALDHSGLPIASYFHDSYGFTSVTHSHDLPTPPDRRILGTGKWQWRTSPFPTSLPGKRISMVTPGTCGLSGPWYQKTSQISS